MKVVTPAVKPPSRLLWIGVPLALLLLPQAGLCDPLMLGKGDLERARNGVPFLLALETAFTCLLLRRFHFKLLQAFVTVLAMNFATFYSLSPYLVVYRWDQISWSLQALWSEPLIILIEGAILYGLSRVPAYKRSGGPPMSSLALLCRVYRRGLIRRARAQRVAAAMLQALEFEELEVSQRTVCSTPASQCPGDCVAGKPTVY
jgi:hypothetical protein